MFIQILTILDNNLLSIFTTTTGTTTSSLPIFFTTPSLHVFLDNLIKSAVGLFVVIDPVGSVPLFIAITEKMGKDERNAVSKIAILTAGALLIVFAIGGTQILSIFGITIFSFMVAGGVLLFIVSIELIIHGVWRFGRGETQEQAQTGKDENAALAARDNRSVISESGVVPLAFPLLAGPGAITSVIISFQTSGLLVTILSVTIVIGITYLILRLVNPIYKLLGRRGSMIITRVFAVFIAAIAVQYIVQGAEQLLRA